MADLDLRPENAGPGGPPAVSEADRPRRVGDAHYRAAEIVARPEQGDGTPSRACSARSPGTRT